MADYVSFERHEVLTPKKAVPPPDFLTPEGDRRRKAQKGLYVVRNVKIWLERKKGQLAAEEWLARQLEESRTSEDKLLGMADGDGQTVHKTNDRFFHIIHNAEGPKSEYLQTYPGQRLPSIIFESDASGSVEERLKKDRRAIEGELLPFIREHGDVYLKDEHGGGGGNILRLFTRKGFLAAQTTNRDMYDCLRQLQHEFRTIQQNVAAAERLRPGTYTPEAHVAAYLTGKGSDKGKRLQLRWSRYVEDTQKQKRPAMDKPIILGNLEDIAGSRAASTLLARTLHVMVPTEIGRLIVQKAIPHLTLGNRPVEIRYVVQRNASGKYVVVCHYAKIGGMRFVSNISRGGRIEQTASTLVAAMEKAFPKIGERKRRRLAESVINEGRQFAEKIMNGDPANRQKIRVETVDSHAGVKIHVVGAPAVLSTVDVVALRGENGATPTVMEHHVSGYFGLADDFRKGYISPDDWARITKQDAANTAWVVAKAKKQLGI